MQRKAFPNFEEILEIFLLKGFLTYFTFQNLFFSLREIFPLREKLGIVTHPTEPSFAQGGWLLLRAWAAPCHVQALIWHLGLFPVKEIQWHLEVWQNKLRAEQVWHLPSMAPRLSSSKNARARGLTQCLTWKRHFKSKCAMSKRDWMSTSVRDWRVCGVLALFANRLGSA